VLGDDLTAYLCAFVVDDLSFSAMARRFGGASARSDAGKHFQSAMKTLLSLLPGIYALADRVRAPRGLSSSAEVGAPASLRKRSLRGRERWQGADARPSVAGTERES
jgi:hypothetical protein